MEMKKMMLQKREEIPFYRRLILPWEEKLRYDTFLVWDGSYRWFRSENVIPLERYQDLETIRRIKVNILNRLTIPSRTSIHSL